MEQRVVWSIAMLCGVLGLVYRAFFRSVDMDTMIIQSLPTDTMQSHKSTKLASSDPLAGFLDNGNTRDPFRDASPELITQQKNLSEASRVQVVNENNEPIVIDGMRFHSTTDLFDGNTEG
jgi:hypothetical protein